MKSAKETLAQYRLQGFSDELIELLAKEEEDKEFAEALLNALVSENNTENTPEIIAADESSETDNSPEDVLESEELIVSAYERAGISDTAEVETEPEINSEYIPPQLEVIEGGADDDDPTIIPFIPEYALSEEEREYAVARSVAFFGEIEHEDELTQYYDQADTVDVDIPENWYIDEVEVAEYEPDQEITEVEAIAVETAAEETTEEEFTCFDFDSIGRSSEIRSAETAAEDLILDLDSSRPAEAEWSENVHKTATEITELRDWAQSVEKDIIQVQQDKKQLAQELNARNDTLVVQGREMEQLQTIHSSYIEQLARESDLLAQAESKICNMQEESARTEHMLLTFGEEIEMLHNQLSIANTRSQSQSTEIMSKDQTLSELNTAYDNLLRQNAAEISAARDIKDQHTNELRRTDATIQQLNREINNLRTQIAALTSARSSQISEYQLQNETINTLDKALDKSLGELRILQNRNEELEKADARQKRRINRLEKVRTKIKKLEFENNVYRTETVPNLQKDKEDLVELASEEYNKVQTLDELAARRSRRFSYATTLAAAACLMLVLMPILSWNNIETEKTNIKSEYSMQLASAEAQNLKLEEKMSDMQQQIELISNEYNTAKEGWKVQLSNLLQKQASGQQNNVIQAAATGNIDESKLNIVAYKEQIMSDDTLNADAGYENDAQYNNVTGLEAYQTEFASTESAEPNIELFEGKQAQVRRGEGLSQVLWRVYRRSNPEMVAYITKLNNLKKDRRGNPMLKIDQKLILPKDVNTAMATEKNITPHL